MTVHLTHLTVYLLDVHVYPIVVIKRLYLVGDRKMIETRDVAVTNVFESVDGHLNYRNQKSSYT